MSAIERRINNRSHNHDRNRTDEIVDFTRLCRVEFESRTEPLTLLHLELLAFINASEDIQACDLYSMCSDSKQTVRSRLKFLMERKLIRKRQKFNLGGNTHNNIYLATKRGSDLINQWPFRTRLESISVLTRKLVEKDRAKPFNIIHMATLVCINDLARKSEASTYFILQKFASEKEITVKRRIQYLKSKGLIHLEKPANPRVGISATYGTTELGKTITKRIK